MNKYAYCILSIILINISTVSFSQVNVKQNDDGSITVTTKGEYLFTNQDGELITEEEQNDFLKANSNYRGYLKFESDNVIQKVQKLWPESEDEIIGNILPKLVYTDINGNDCEIIDGDNPFLLCFWDKYCGNCIAELDILNRIADEFPTLRIVGITPDELSETQELMENKHINWRNITIITDYKNEYFPMIQSIGHPTTVIVSKSGKIEKAYFGKKMRKMIVYMDSYFSDNQ